MRAASLLVDFEVPNGVLLSSASAQVPSLLSSARLLLVPLSGALGYAHVATPAPFDTQCIRRAETRLSCASPFLTPDHPPGLLPCQGATAHGLWDALRRRAPPQRVPQPVRRGTLARQQARGVVGREERRRTRQARLGAPDALGIERGRGRDVRVPQRAAQRHEQEPCGGEQARHLCRRGREQHAVRHLEVDEQARRAHQLCVRLLLIPPRDAVVLCLLYTSDAADE